MELFKDNETTIQLEHNMLIRESQLIGGKPVGYFTRHRQGFIIRLPRINPASGQGRTGTRGHQITSPRWVLQISSDRNDQRIFWGYNLVSSFLGVT